MKFFLPFLLVAVQFSCAQRRLTDVTNNTQSADRLEMLAVLDKQVEKDLNQKVTIIVSSLKMKNNYAFLKGNVKDGNSNNIDFRHTVYKDSVDHGSFSGDEIFALLKKASGKWVYVTHAIGPMNVVYACWWQHFSAPKQLFDKTEQCSADKY